MRNICDVSRSTNAKSLGGNTPETASGEHTKPDIREVVPAGFDDSSSASVTIGLPNLLVDSDAD